MKKANLIKKLEALEIEIPDGATVNELKVLLDANSDKGSEEATPSKKA